MVVLNTTGRFERRIFRARMGKGKSGLSDGGFGLMRLGSLTVRLEFSILATTVSPLTDMDWLNSTEMNATATVNLLSEMIISIRDKLI